MKTTRIYTLLALLLMAGGVTMQAQTELLWSDNYAVGHIFYTTQTPFVRGIHDVKDYVEVTGETYFDDRELLERVLYDIYGNIVSIQTFGTDSDYDKTIIDYQFDNSDNVYLLNNERLEFYKSRIVLQKYSLDGELLWESIIQNEADTSFTACHLAVSDDGRVAVAALKEYDYPAPGDDYIITTSIPCVNCYNPDGDPLWNRYYSPDEDNPLLYDMIVVDNVMYMFGANRIMTKLSFDNIQLYKGNLNTHGTFANAQPTTNGNLLITSYMNYSISEIDLDGNMIWSHDYGTYLPSNVSGDQIRAMIQDEDGNIYVTGKHYGMNYGTPDFTNADILTLKYDPNGNLLWENRYEFGGNNADIGNALFLKDGYLYVGGQSQLLGQGHDYDYLVLKIDATTGERTGCYRYKGGDDLDDMVTSVFVFDDGKVAITGIHGTQNSEWTTQLLSDIFDAVGEVHLSFVEIYPNPAKDKVVVEGVKSIKVQVYNALGQVVKTVRGTNEIDLSGLVDGVYLVKVKDCEGKIFMEKVMVR